MHEQPTKEFDVHIVAGRKYLNYCTPHGHVSQWYILKTIDSKTAHNNLCHGEYTRGNLVSITISHLVLCMQ